MILQFWVNFNEFKYSLGYNIIISIEACVSVQYFFTESCHYEIKYEEVSIAI